MEEKRIDEVIKEITKDIPDEEWDKVPQVDGSGPSNISKHLEGLREYFQMQREIWDDFQVEKMDVVIADGETHLEAVERWVKGYGTEMSRMHDSYMQVLRRQRALRSALEEARGKTDELEYALTPFSVKPSDGVDTLRFKRWNKVGGKLIELRAALSHKGEEGKTVPGSYPPISEADDRTVRDMINRARGEEGETVDPLEGLDPDGNWDGVDAVEYVSRIRHGDCSCGAPADLYEACPECGKTVGGKFDPPPSPPLCSNCGGSGWKDRANDPDYDPLYYDGGASRASGPGPIWKPCQECNQDMHIPKPTCKGGKGTKDEK
jgi:hypothetical protein